MANSRLNELTPGELLAAICFAAEKHRDGRRKDADASPYVNHPIEVAETLARTGGVTDADVLRAAVLHDTLEDTETTKDELTRHFGAAVAELVAEVTDDKSLPKDVRKRLGIEHAPRLSAGAKLIKLGDKICNVRDVANAPPKDWDAKRRLEYFAWARAVVDGCRGVSPALEKCFDELAAEGEERVRAEA